MTNPSTKTTYKLVRQPGWEDLTGPDIYNANLVLPQPYQTTAAKTHSIMVAFGDAMRLG